MGECLALQSSCWCLPGLCSLATQVLWLERVNPRQLAGASSWWGQQLPVRETAALPHCTPANHSLVQSCTPWPPRHSLGHSPPFPQVAPRCMCGFGRVGWAEDLVVLYVATLCCRSGWAPPCIVLPARLGACGRSAAWHRRVSAPDLRSAHPKAALTPRQRRVVANALPALPSPPAQPLLRSWKMGHFISSLPPEPKPDSTLGGRGSAQTLYVSPCRRRSPSCPPPQLPCPCRAHKQHHVRNSNSRSPLSALTPALRLPLHCSLRPFWSLFRSQTGTPGLPWCLQLPTPLLSDEISPLSQPTSVSLLQSAICWRKHHSCSRFCGPQRQLSTWCHLTHFLLVLTQPPAPFCSANSLNYFPQSP